MFHTPVRHLLSDDGNGSNAHGGEGESTTPPGSPTNRPSGSLPALGSGDASSSSATKRPYVPDASDKAVVKKIKAAEIELRDRNSVLRGVKPSVCPAAPVDNILRLTFIIQNFSSVRTVYAETLKKMREPAKGGAPATSGSTPGASRVMLTFSSLLSSAQTRRCLQESKVRPLQRLAHRAYLSFPSPEHMHPIIMVSSSPTSLITMHNVKRFLEESMYVHFPT